MASLENGRFSPRLESVINRWCEEVTEAQTALTQQIAEGREQLGRLAKLLSAPGAGSPPNIHPFHEQVSALKLELERQERRAADAERRLAVLSEERVKLDGEVAQLRARQSREGSEGRGVAQRQRERALEKELRRARARIASLEEAAVLQTNQAKAISKALKNAEEEASRLRGEAANRLEAQARIEDELRRAQTHIASLEEAALLQSSQTEALLNALKNAEEEVSRLRGETVTLRVTQAQNDKEKSELRAGFDRMLAETQWSTDALRQAQAAMDEHRRAETIREAALLRAGIETNRLQDEVRRLQDESQAMRDAHAKALDQWDRQWSLLETSAGEVRGELREAVEYAARLRQELLRVQSAADTQGAGKARLESELAEANRRLREGRNEKDVLIAERDALRAGLTLEKEAHAQARSSRAQLLQEIRRVRGQAADMAMENQKLRREVAEANRRTDETRRALGAMEEELRRTRSSLRGAIEKNEAIDAEKGTVAKALDRARHEIAPLKNQLAERDAELRALRDHAARWEQDLERAGGHWVAQRGVLTRELELFRSRLLTDAVFFLEPLTEELEHLQLRQEAVGTLLEGLQRNATLADDAAITRRAEEPLPPGAVSPEDLPGNVRPLDFANEPAKGRLRQASR